MRATLAAATIAALLAATLPAREASAEVNEVRFAQQFSMGYLQFNVMSRQHLLEKHAAALGIPDLKVTFVTFNGPDMMNDALLSGAVDVVSGGVPGLVTIWAKTHGTSQEVRGISALGGSPIFVNTRNPNVHAIGDFGPGDKIALPAVKVAIQAVLIEMASAKLWGDENYAKLDGLTMSLSPPDATAGLLSGGAEFNSAATVPPFQEIQLKNPAIHSVFNSQDLLGPDTTTVVAWTSKRFHDANPNVYRALVEALKEASDFVMAHKREAVGYYVEASKSKMNADDIAEMIASPSYFYAVTPHATMQFATFMHRVGKTKAAPESWKDLFFPEIYDLPGS